MTRTTKRLWGLPIMTTHSRAIGLQLPEQASDLRARFNDLCDGFAVCDSRITNGGTSGPVVDPLADGEVSDLRLKNLGWAWRAGLISDGEAIGLFLCEARRRRDERQDG